MPKTPSENTDYTTQRANLVDAVGTLNKQVDIVNEILNFRITTVALVIVVVFGVIAIFFGRKWMEKSIDAKFKKSLATHTAELNHLRDLSQSILPSLPTPTCPSGATKPIAYSGASLATGRESL